MATRLDIHAMTMNGVPVGCPECATTRFTLDAAGPVAVGPALANCVVCSHAWEDPLLSVDVMRMIQRSRSGRAKASDQDTFAIRVYGVRIEGVLAPEPCLDDVKTILKLNWRKHAKPLLRKPKTAAKRFARRQARKATRGARSAAATATAAVLAADWQARAGGHTKRPLENPCGACTGHGGFEIDTRLHDTTWVRCAVCRGTGETL
ncbi:hypothetical protein AB0B15_14300 [Streptomyces sp. NPDC045456]|uniref:hypothetical protein n=1 Tax=Streptomyces sp. NPDC045456 TaxID=3155254 RepID=UPI0033ED278F